MKTKKSDKFQESCGIFGIFNHPEAAKITYLGLHALQHRGQESAGISTAFEGKLHSEKGMGLVTDVFNKDRLEKLPGNNAIGHVRYSTLGSSSIENAQPTVAESSVFGKIALAHNGTLTNAPEIRKRLEYVGSVFLTTTDSEVILQQAVRFSETDLPEAFQKALRIVKGAYSLVILTENELIGVRDPFGFRPLSIGQLDGSYIIASETCAFDLIRAEFVRDIIPGEMVIIDSQGLRSFQFQPTETIAQCIFEYIYFSRPDSIVFGHSVHSVRKKMGANLALENPVQADIVVPIPDAGICAALGYANTSGIAYERGLVRSHYVGRTFIEPKQSIRDFGVKLKLNPIKDVIAGKRVILVDDSIVRGTTTKRIVKMVRSCGASEIHMRVSSPPVKYSCFYGIDTPSRKELIAANYSIEEIRRFLDVDSLHYLSLEGLMDAVPNENKHLCVACYNGDYPIPVLEIKEPQLALFDLKD